MGRFHSPVRSSQYSGVMITPPRSSCRKPRVYGSQLAISGYMVKHRTKRLDERIPPTFSPPAPSGQSQGRQGLPLDTAGEPCRHAPGVARSCQLTWHSWAAGIARCRAVASPQTCEPYEYREDPDSATVGTPPSAPRPESNCSCCDVIGLIHQAM